METNNYQNENLNPRKRRKLLEEAAESSIKYLDSLDSRRVSPDQNDLLKLEEFNPNSRMIRLSQNQLLNY